MFCVLQVAVLMTSSSQFYDSWFSLPFQLFQEIVLGQVYHFKITYYIYQSFFAPYYYQLFMNKQENQTYAKLEDKKWNDFSNYQKVC